MDPYRVLELKPEAEKRDIIQAAALALRKRRYSGHEIALAQKELLDPVKKQAHAFLCRLDLEAESLEPDAALISISRENRLQKQQPVLDLERLTFFDED